MRKFVTELGVFFLTIILFAIPILTTCAFIYQWRSIFAFLLFIASVIDIITLSVLITHYVDVEDLQVR